MRQLKPKPFSFLQREKNKKNVMIYVDVNIAPGKTGRIAVHEGDNPKQLAKNFCNVYHLNEEMEEMLEDLLIQQINDHLSTS